MSCLNESKAAYRFAGTRARRRQCGRDGSGVAGRKVRRNVDVKQLYVTDEQFPLKAKAEAVLRSAAVFPSRALAEIPFPLLPKTNAGNRDNGNIISAICTKCGQNGPIRLNNGTHVSANQLFYPADPK